MCAVSMGRVLLWHSICHGTNKMGSGERLVVREKVCATLARNVKGRYTWGKGFDNRRIGSHWGAYLRFSKHRYTTTLEY